MRLSVFIYPEFNTTKNGRLLKNIILMMLTVYGFNNCFVRHLKLPKMFKYYKSNLQLFHDERHIYIAASKYHLSMADHQLNLYFLKHH